MQPGILLLVEDNPSDVDLTARALRKSRIANPLVVVQDGQEALDYLFGTHLDRPRTPEEMPALVLLDLNLPRIDGLTVLRRMRGDARTRRVPVVILTTSLEERDLIQGYDLGANSYVRKPVRFEQFAQVIEELGMYWLVLNEPPPR
jgi:two-component system, response regulator